MPRNTDFCCKCVWSYYMPFECYTLWFTMYCIYFPGFAGTNALEEANILMIGGCVLDTLSPLYKMYGVKEQDAKASSRIGLDKDNVSFLVILNPHWNCVLSNISGCDIFFIFICHSCIFFTECCVHCCGLQIFHVSAWFLLLSLFVRIVWSQSNLSENRPMFVLVSLFLFCRSVFLLLLSAEYHNVLMCS